MWKKRFPQQILYDGMNSTIVIVPEGMNKYRNNLSSCELKDSPFKGDRTHEFEKLDVNTFDKNHDMNSTAKGKNSQLL